MAKDSERQEVVKNNSKIVLYRAINSLMSSMAGRKKKRFSLPGSKAPPVLPKERVEDDGASPEGAPVVEVAALDASDAFSSSFRPFSRKDFRSCVGESGASLSQTQAQNAKRSLSAHSPLKIRPPSPP